MADREKKREEAEDSGEPRYDRGNQASEGIGSSASRTSGAGAGGTAATSGDGAGQRSDVAGSPGGTEGVKGQGGDDFERERPLDG